MKFCWWNWSFCTLALFLYCCKMHKANKALEVKQLNQLYLETWFKAHVQLFMLKKTGSFKKESKNGLDIWFLDLHWHQETVAHSIVITIIVETFKIEEGSNELCLCTGINRVYVSLYLCLIRDLFYLLPVPDYSLVWLSGKCLCLSLCETGWKVVSFCKRTDSIIGRPLQVCTLQFHSGSTLYLLSP